MADYYVPLPPQAAITWKSAVATSADLPTSGNTTGDARVAMDTAIIYVWNGSAWVSSGGDGGVLTVGTIDSQTAAANGLVISGTVIYAQSASATVPGMVNLTTQSFAGNKTFTGTLAASNLSGTNTGNVTIGTANGLSLAAQALSLAAASGSVTGALTSTDWTTFNNKQATVTIGAFNGTSTANGLDITTNAIALHAADATNPGAVSTTTQTFAGNKRFNDQVGINQAVSGGSLAIKANGTNNNSALSLTSTTGNHEWDLYPETNGYFYFKSVDNSFYSWVVDNNGQMTVGGTSTSAMLHVKRASDVIQLIAQGHSTQTLDIFQIRKSDDTVLFKVTNTGACTLGPTSSAAVQTLNGGVTNTVRSTSTNLTIDTTTKDYNLMVDTSGGAVSLTLPAPVAGRTFRLVDTTNSFITNNLTLVRNGSEKINNVAASKVLSTGGPIWTIVTDGTNWWIG